MSSELPGNIPADVWVGISRKLSRRDFYSLRSCSFALFFNRKIEDEYTRRSLSVFGEFDEASRVNNQASSWNIFVREGAYVWSEDKFTELVARKILEQSGLLETVKKLLK